jgi:CheY-like chemotaxis protein
MSDPGERPLSILIVEDNAIDAKMITYSLGRETTWATRTVIIPDGETAINYLISPPRDIPDLVILDLNLPKRNGIEVLQVIRATKSVEELPVVMLSSSPEDIMRTEARKAKVSANQYITKPAEVGGYFDLIKELREAYKRCQGGRDHNARAEE